MADGPVRHYCTLFDRNYLLKGLALYRSLERHGGAFVLHVLCMDNIVHELLERMALANVQLIRGVDFEDPELLAVKPTRTVAEYCWTCTPSLPLYLFERHPDVDLVTYLDADLFFFSSPDPIFAEFGDASILIVEHRFAQRFAHFAVNGKYNVEWVSFRRDANGMAALRWWRAKCIEWCFHRLEEDRMGDQKYLDHWPTQFQGVHVLQHVGAGVAPWNFSNYRIWSDDGSPMVDDLALIFYHFHGFRYRANGHYVATTPMYRHGAALPRSIYYPYGEAIEEALAFARGFDPGFSFGIEPADGIATPSELVARAYWVVPEWCRAAARKIFPRTLRGRLLRALARRDDRAL